MSVVVQIRHGVRKIEENISAEQQKAPQQTRLHEKNVHQVGAGYPEKEKS
jgi:hypothetical protein